MGWPSKKASISSQSTPPNQGSLATIASSVGRKFQSNILYFEREICRRLNIITSSTQKWQEGSIYVAQCIVVVSCCWYHACPHIQQVHARVLSRSELSQEFLFPEHLAATNTHTINTAFAQCHYKNLKIKAALQFTIIPKARIQGLLGGDSHLGGKSLSWGRYNLEDHPMTRKCRIPW